MSASAHEGHIYVVGYDTGTIKVGYTANPTQRIRVLELAARQLGCSVDRTWVSSPHVNAHENEQHLLEFCSSSGSRVTGGRTGEFFNDLDFEAVVQHAERLPMEREQAPACAQQILRGV